MKRLFGMFCSVLMASVMLTSCLRDDDDDIVTTYSDVAITQFTLGTLNRYTTTTSATTGRDTLIKTTVAGSGYKMTIDQLGHRIYNREQLPVGTDVKHVLCTISTRNGGIVALQSMTSDSLSWFSATDSIDFSVPRTFRVYAIDGSAYRDYEVSLTASATQGVDFAWQRVATVAAPADGQHLVAIADTVMTADAGVVSFDRRAFRLADDGSTLECSDDLTQWTAVGPAPGLSRLVGSSAHRLFALSDDGRLWATTDAQATGWREERLDDDATLLPDADIATVSWPYMPVDNTDYVLMAGRNSRSEEAYAALWRKLDYRSADGQWVFMTPDDANRQRLPAVGHLSLACFENVVLAVGDDLTVRLSKDQGITWPASTTYALPSVLEAAWVTMATDARERLWLLTDRGELWQGARR